MELYIDSGAARETVPTRDSLILYEGLALTMVEQRNVATSRPVETCRARAVRPAYVFCCALCFFCLKPLFVVAQSHIDPERDDAPRCYHPKSASQPVGASSNIPLGEKWLWFDTFDGSRLDPEYQVQFGRGGYGFIGRSLQHGTGALVYELDEEAALVSDGDLINLTADGGMNRPYAPSLLITRQWQSQEWTFDTAVTYGVANSCNGCHLNLWIAFEGINDRNRNSIKISRLIKADPKDSGELRITASDDDGKPVGDAKITLNQADTYFFRAVRKQNEIEVLVSSDAISYQRVMTYVLTSKVAYPQQWMIANGWAFTGGCAYEAFHYFRVHGKPTHTLPASQRVRSVFRLKGKTKDYVAINADQIIKAIAAGQDIDVAFAVLKGELNLGLVGKRPIASRITFRHCRFRDRVLGTDLTFTDDVSFVDTDFADSFQLSNSRFQRRFDVTSSVFHRRLIPNPPPTLLSNNQFELGADFSEATFEAKPTFRLTQFAHPASFWRTNFLNGADLSGVKFLQGVSFTDFSNSTADTPIETGPEMLFFGSTFCGRVSLESTFSRPNRPTGRNISFQGAHINELIISGGNTDPGAPQEGPALWLITSGLSLRDAEIGTLLLKDVAFTSQTAPVDFRDINFGAPAECRTSSDAAKPARPFQLVNVDLADVRFTEWPVGEVAADQRSTRRIIAILQPVDPALARISFFDQLVTGRYYDKWRHAKPKPQRFEDYWGYRLEKPLLRGFWLISDYGTGFWSTILTGFMLTILFAVIFLLLDWGRDSLIYIDKPFELRTRLSDTPVLSFGESPRITTDSSTIASVQSGKFYQLRRHAVMALVFSFNVVLKIGFGNVRLRSRYLPEKFIVIPIGFQQIEKRLERNARRSLVVSVWLGWIVGFGWYILLLYTLAVFPVLSGLAKG